MTCELSFKSYVKVLFPLANAWVCPLHHCSTCMVTDVDAVMIGTEFVYEDMDAMTKELAKWRGDYTRYSESLEQETK
jgi:hypothetical protein